MVFTTTTTTTSTTTPLPLPIPYNHQPEREPGPEPDPIVFVTPLSVTPTDVQETASEESPPGLMEAASTGRAVDYRTSYPFGQLITPLIKSARPSQNYKNYKSKGNRYQNPQRGYTRGTCESII